MVSKKIQELKDNTTSLPLGKKSVILQAAAHVFLQHGFSAATTDMIQREAGVSKSTVYAHYPNKESLFIAVVQAKCANLPKEITHVSLERAHLDEALLHMAQTYLAFVLEPESVALFRMTIAEAVRFPHLATRFFEEGPLVFHAAVVRVMNAAVNKQQLDVSSVGLDSAAWIFTGLVRGEAQFRLLFHPGERPTQSQIDAWCNNAVLTFLRAFRV